MYSKVEFGGLYKLPIIRGVVFVFILQKIDSIFCVFECVISSAISVFLMANKTPPCLSDLSLLKISKSLLIISEL